MTGLSIGLTGDIYDPARERIRGTLILLAETKCVALTAFDRESITEGVLVSIAFPTLFTIANGRARAARDEMHWRLNNCLDYVAARYMVELFHHASQLPALEDHEFGRLMDGVVHAAKEPNPIGGPTVCWPAPAAMSWTAINAFPLRSPRSLPGLRSALDDAMEAFGIRRLAPIFREGAQA
jgi:hypothetical protein